MLDIMAAAISLTDLGAIASVLVMIVGIWNYKAAKKLTETSIVAEEVQTLRDLLSSQNERLKGNKAVIKELEKDIADGLAKNIETKATNVAERLERKAEQVARDK